MSINNPLLGLPDDPFATANKKAGTTGTYILPDKSTPDTAEKPAAKDQPIDGKALTGVLRRSMRPSKLGAVYGGPVGWLRPTW